MERAQEEIITEKVIAKEWDNIVKSRTEVIQKGLDKSYINILLPQIQSRLELDKNIEKIVDCGCGNGHLANSCAVYCKEIIGIDISEKSIQIAKEQYQIAPNIKFYRKSIIDFSNTFKEFSDICIANMVLSNIIDCEKNCKAIYKILKEGGRFLITLPHPCFWSEHWGYDREEWFDYKKQIIMSGDFAITGVGVIGKSTHIHRPIEMYFAMLQNVGFLINDVEELMWKKNMECDSFKKPRFLFIECTK